ncbi:probable galactinol--sucrose galactosyltransferase 6 [Olea europaea var. sylvestris]|uniref:galactinol--sucrose galactosyltransferase n=1 Tax=Olea europaea subsp. europaea TaxID=158383 RepID=A0A8S0QZU4_OLEEU|nr:probable galactinol--sucrose galactosyltransferase 6 [Olea europaea var. sylvestris]CAA2972149.1 probable galactinol--sucrose galactosyltransferase 6 [Olea europaea subsp. europaea]
MNVKIAIGIADRKLLVKDRTILTNVSENVVATSSSAAGMVEGLFLGAVFDQDDSRQVVPLGTLRDVHFLACFRFNLWWMTQKMSDKGRDIPMETQFLLLESKNGSSDNNEIIYTVILPLVEGPFKASLQGNDKDEVELCLESGDMKTVGSVFGHSVYISAGTDPFETIHEAMRAVKLHLGTFRLRHEKKLPGIVDYFGWCTWDAFYHEVTQEGVEAGLKSLSAGGAPLKFVIIDDGWQTVGFDDDKTQQHKQLILPMLRLTGIQENEKFQNEVDPTAGMKNIVNIAKEKYGLKYVYIWHAITGYWAGVRPGVKEMEEYGCFIQYLNLSKGVVENEPRWRNEAIVVEGLGLVNPKNAYKFYNDLHSHLASAGIDGVKVDGQCLLETLGTGLGGRVQLTSQYQQAIDASVAKNFPDNECIACRSHNIDSFYCSKQTALVRASEGFSPLKPISHTIHIASVAYNSIFLGEFMLPDWDMFHSLHPAAEYHGSARAISGGPVYVSDAPGKHNFDLLKKLVLTDGSILRAQLPGRPTKDCLFSDPTRDGVSLLKIWNMNKYTGVLGVYNCQGAAWNIVEKKKTFHQTKSEAITGYFRGDDVHLISEVALDSSWNGDCIVYSHRGGDLVTLSHNVSMLVSLKVLEHEIFTITPVKILASRFSFAPLGLIDMFNSGGAIEGLKYEVIGKGYEGNAEERLQNLSIEVVALVSMKVKGCGRFGAYSSAKPRKCRVELSEVDFAYELASGLVTMNLLNMPPEDQKVHTIEIEL